MDALTELAGWLQSLHLLRPTLLWALLAIVPAAALWHWRRRDADVWRQSVDAHLLPKLLVSGGRRGWLGFVLAALTYALAVIAMSGPSWRQTERPVFQSSMPLVVVLDLSSSANATDLPPSRLLQARAKLATLLRKRAGGEVALLVYAGESFTVAPLTEDSANVALFLDALSPSVMPVDGKRADRAIDAAAQLLQQAGFKQGEILLVSDSADRSAESSARVARSRGFSVSALGVGGERGAAYRTASGEIAQAKLDEGSLRTLAAQGGGRYARIAPDDADLRALGVLDPSQQPLADETAESDGGKSWLDEGYWLVLPVMLLSLLAFRRRAVVAVLAMVCVLPLAQPAHAADGTLWQRADQVQQQRLDAGVQAYRKGDFAAAQKAFEAVPTDEGLYNLGNALARQGQYDAAIAAYDRALKQHPNQQDAIANRAAVDAARKRQQQTNKDGKGQSKDLKPSGQDGKGQQQAGQNQQDKQSGQDGQNQHDSKNQPSEGQPPQDGRPQDAQAKNGQGEQRKQDTPPQSADAKAQQQADEAQRRKMQQAMAQAGNKQADASGKQEAAVAGETPEQREQRQAVDAWLRRVPDDPGSLLRTKFRLEYERRQRDGR
ncbi:VWA domain-containing protein [Xanthomonas euvesicatoria pv. eucalypti]|uniref:VWA domain-containing protein n=1 Tax=Xanthomonas euvesicatoria TaxID=456327 RepID=UPI0026E25DA8|nr:VWA domain-containing protein [Xanthomonas euvesicatoria]MDO7933178.1 VWA domain-containing protein [Xanthomonas euvesicatoria pv. eucalypti]MDO7937847.1 VWA domain-containing protein [Xanthomonas euvesicatoria pv. eucalypti]MDO7942153.1 VWA domain-containing protein [Xanthomonas euvesicatoria pv. eucalypti]MDO7946335.1 VWA domain-containing protein [Xanthomonas euvesicatoria pv. eucalypti]MDO7947779.1 VWA domain-containing protein [Xanthomonas euvesicatoria pv. eucalypti]